VKLDLLQRVVLSFFYLRAFDHLEMSQVFSKSFGKVRLFGIKICDELDQTKSLVLSCHVSRVVRVKFGWNSLLVEIRGLTDVGELGAGFRFRQVRRDKVAREASRSVSRVCPRTENEGCAFRHVIDVA
jgi:hypothetical protein